MKCKQCHGSGRYRILGRGVLYCHCPAGTLAQKDDAPEKRRIDVVAEILLGALARGGPRGGPESGAEDPKEETEDPMTEKIRGVLLRPAEDPRRIEVENKLKPLQELIGGYLEEASIAPGIVALMDEDGIRKGLPVLGRVGPHEVRGPCLIVGKRGTEWCSLDEATFRSFRWGREDGAWGAHWFGEPGDEGVADVIVPVGCLCSYCEEPIGEEDSGAWLLHGGGGPHASHRPVHRECIVRRVMGPAPDERAEDPRRTRAKHAFAYWSRDRPTWY